MRVRSARARVELPLGSSIRGFLDLATLRRSRSLLRGRRPLLLLAAIAVGYAFISMLVGLMLEFHAESIPLSAEVISDPSAYQWWDYPALLVVWPGGILVLPFLPAVTMVLVSLGVAIGATVAVRLLAPLVRRRRDSGGRSAASGVAGGTTPSIVGVATLGACCCTSCAGIAGATVVAAVSGTNLYNALLNNWYIDLFQLAVVWMALMVQERALRMGEGACQTPAPFDRKTVASYALRLALMIAGITWSLAMFVEWGDASPASASPAIWYHWTFEHQLLSITAVIAAFLPQETLGMVRRALAHRWSWIARTGLVVGGVTWGIWVPAALTGIGLGGFLNELIGFLGLPPSWGAVPPNSSLGPALYFHWAFQHELLSAFAIILALFPERAISPLVWSVTRTPAVRAQSEMEILGDRGASVPSPVPGPTPSVTTQPDGSGTSQVAKPL